MEVSDREPPTRADLVAIAGCMVVGVVLATLPHVLWWPRLGAPVWLADHDDLDIYVTLGSVAYWNHPASLADPMSPAGGPSPYPPLQMVPGILAARALRLGPLGINLIWRAWAGVAMAAGWYALARHYLGRPGASAAVAVVLLGDSGLLSAMVVAKHVENAARLALGRTGGLLDQFPLIHPEWRIVTPGLSLPWLLLFLWLLARARERPTGARVACAGVGFGFLFHVYFYYWTTAGLGLLLALGLDGGRRRVAFHVGWIGVLIGLPALIDGAEMKRIASPDWLPRGDNFLPISRFSELLVPKGGLLILAATGPWVWRRRRDLLPLWLVSAAGLALMNHQVVSGLQIQNYHWIFAWGPCLSLLVLLLTSDGFRRLPGPARGKTGLVVALVACHLAAALGMRGVEATRTRETVAILEGLERYRADRDAMGPVAFRPGAVIAGDGAFVVYAVVLENLHPLDHYAIMNSPRISDDEWDARVALNRFLLGDESRSFHDRQARTLTETPWGPWGRGRDPARLAARIGRRDAAFAAVVADPRAALERFQVRYVALPGGMRPPRANGIAWHRVAAGPTWSVWTWAPSPPG